MLAFLPHGTANSRVDELRATARSRLELEALAIEKYQRDVLAYRVYLKLPAHEVQLYPPRQQPQARRSMG